MQTESPRESGNNRMPFLIGVVVAVLLVLALLLVIGATIL